MSAAEGQEDLRPHYYDPVLKTTLLVDSGSQVTAFPPDPGDIEDNSVKLKAVNGTVIKTYGYKKISIKINRKSYPFVAIKAQVDKPVIGWDFMKRHRLDLRWGQWGDLFLYDRIANIHGRCEVKSVTSKRHLRLSVIKSQQKTFNLDLPLMLAALEEVAAEDPIGNYEEVKTLINSRTLLIKRC